MKQKTEVLIVGAGPTGLVLAPWLTRLGVKVCILDKAAEPGTTSRALAVHARILEVDRVNWFSNYHVHHRVAGHFRKGRVFLLGDAAHIHSPVGGQGMNTGIGDAVSLAWKVAGVVHGRAGITSTAMSRSASHSRGGGWQLRTGPSSSSIKTVPSPASCASM
jgi:2-polyprenyl-6-methoxyphenol hydroxylase-like FAD-dependent oxidoreductase